MTRILIVEDELAIRRLLVTFFEMWGCKADSAENAFEALEILKDEKYDIIITDGMMPYVNGPKFTKIIKDKDPQTYVIALTGSDLKKEFYAAGVNAYLEKPVDLKRLQTAIEGYFKNNIGGRR